MDQALAPDQATFSKSRVYAAKLRIEINISKPWEEEIWVGYSRLENDNEDGFWLKVEYEQVPDYCHYCCMQGHTENVCYTKKNDMEHRMRQEKVKKKK